MAINNHQDEELRQIAHCVDELKASLPYINEKIKHLENQCDNNSEVVHELRRIDCGQQEILKRLEDSIERLQHDIQNIENRTPMVRIDGDGKYHFVEDSLKIVLIAIAVVAFVVTNGMTFPL